MTDIVDTAEQAAEHTAEKHVPGAGGPWRDKRYICEHYGISTSALERHMASGVMPRPVKIGRLNRWHDTQLQKFDEALLAQYEG
ncbi:hypothetical protein Q4485_11130 [Granulosicoccaceae sp. 1_MG-2023]|nr:hypothetical protein [Granulosicoccaceae sp. 1_MG-2023]